MPISIEYLYLFLSFVSIYRLSACREYFNAIGWNFGIWDWDAIAQVLNYLLIEMTSGIRWWYVTYDSKNGNERE
jgi:hypothetical protein